MHRGDHSDVGVSDAMDYGTVRYGKAVVRASGAQSSGMVDMFNIRCENRKGCTTGK